HSYLKLNKGAATILSPLFLMSSRLQSPRFRLSLKPHLLPPSPILNRSHRLHPACGGAATCRRYARCGCCECSGVGGGSIVPAAWGSALGGRARAGRGRGREAGGRAGSPPGSCTAADGDSSCSASSRGAAPWGRHVGDEAGCSGAVAAHPAFRPGSV